MRILSWNIENLTLKRVFSTAGATQVEQTDNLDRTTANVVYIASTVREADPDVFVVIEPRCGQTYNVGTLATGGGVEALLHILVWLRQDSPHWMLVPPIVVNPVAFRDGLEDRTRSETVGYFFRDDRVQFTGPWAWPAAATATGPPIAPGGAAAGNYPAAYDGVTVPANTTAAPRLEWHDANGRLKLFPGANDRRPLQARFVERNAPGRTVDVLALHPSPARAREMLSNLGDVLARDVVPGANGLTVVVGDINVNLLAQNVLEADALRWLESRCATPYVRVPPNPLVSTMLKRTAGRYPATPAAYVQKNKCLDYGWVRYGAGAQVTPPSARVVNRVAGTAATATIPAFTSHMDVSLGDLDDMMDEDERNDAFRSRWNYGHISPPKVGTSDHLPVVLAV